MVDGRPAYSTFNFESYSFDPDTGEASFHYNFDGKRHFVERITFDMRLVVEYDRRILDRALRLALLVTGTSYYKTFPTPNFGFGDMKITKADTTLLSAVYREGLSQFIYENDLDVDQMVKLPTANEEDSSFNYASRGILVLQSGGKDSLLLAKLLDERRLDYSTMMIGSTDAYPSLLDGVGSRPLRLVKRVIDRQALASAAQDGGLSGHVPITYITLAYALIDAVLHGEHMVLAAIGNEGAEPHAWIGDLAINHQWSKTWQAEQLFADYVANMVSPDIRVGSPLRAMSELKIAELFSEKAWGEYGHRFSSCNLANYRQGNDNTTLTWCGNCPKCANSYLLFAPFVAPVELQGLFDGQDLFAKPSLVDTFKGLLGIDGIMKPFECVGEIDELRSAYHIAQSQGYSSLPFDVPGSDYDRERQHAGQSWASDILR